MNIQQRRSVSLLLAAAVAAIGVLLQIHDAPLLAATIAAAGLLWSGRERASWLIASFLVAAGVLWSSTDIWGCSVWGRGSIVFAKLVGKLPYFAWADVPGAVVAPCLRRLDPPDWLLVKVQLLESKTIHGARLERHRTELGDFWITEGELDVLAFVSWELTGQGLYESKEVRIRPGDTVIDCGAHVGVFSRFALNQGASRVIAIEPDPVNLICLEENFADEIASGRVTLIRGGVWYEEAVLPLSQKEGNSAARSFIYSYDESVEGIPVFPLDKIVADQNLVQVDFVKMDIEGSEHAALQGAADTIERFKPRMAICTYHLPDDPDVIPRVVLEARPDYAIHVKDLALHARVRPKVMFFQ